MTPLGPALTGAMATAGMLLLAGELTRKAPPPGTPPARRPLAGRLTAASARRLLLAAAAGFAVLLVTGWPVAGVGAAAAAVYVPKLGIGKAQRRQIDVLEALEQWTRSVSDLLGAGLALEAALASSAARAPAAIAGPVGDLARGLAGRPGPEAALRAFAGQVADPAADRIAAALITAAGARGGKVREVLNALAGMMARDVEDRRRTDAEQAQHRAALRGITVVILVFASGILIFDRPYSAPYGTPAGEVVLAAILAVGAVAVMWLHRLGVTPAPGRFLTEEGRAAAGTAPRSSR
jgi:Flp pilus assembly protein TadB